MITNALPEIPLEYTSGSLSSAGWSSDPAGWLGCREEQLAVGRGVGRASGQVEILEPFLKVVQDGDVGVDGGPREVLELRVVLVQARPRSLAWGST